jgi:hypothetical protein
MSVASLDRSRSYRRNEILTSDQAARRVLIVSPHFPPINAPDHHRVRLALPHFAESGWAAEVLAVRAGDVEGIIDPELAGALPPATIIHRVAAIPSKWTRRFGVGNLALRAYRQLRLQGDALLASGRFDLVFFSTTQFGVLPLGPYWKRRHGIPYVLDFQDEWAGDYYRDHPAPKPPGGRLKYAAAQWLARHQEIEVVKEAAQIVCVSPGYVEHFRAKHPASPPELFHELPFGGAEADFSYLARVDRPQQRFFNPADGRKHWVYVGRGGADMHQAADAFFSAVRRALDASLLKSDELRIHFLGTSYAPGKLAKRSFAPLARTHGLVGIVKEDSARLPYFTALQCLRQADALIVPGSDDAGYTASKIYSYILARKPLLAIFHEESSVVKIVRETQAGTVITFASSQSREVTSDQIFRAWLLTREFETTPELRAETFAAYSAATMTRRLAGIFDLALIGAR